MADHLLKFASSSAGEAANTDDVATVSSGNVFADLGFDDPAEERLKSQLVYGIASEIERRRISQREAGRLMGLSQPDVSKLLRGRTGGYTLDRLLAFTRALGGDVSIEVRQRNAAPKPGRMAFRVLEPA